MVPSATPSATAFRISAVFSVFIRAFHLPRSNLLPVRFLSTPSVIASMIRRCICRAAVMRLTMELAKDAASRLEVNGDGPHSTVVVPDQRL
jgi:hypothetical protein